MTNYANTDFQKEIDIEFENWVKENLNIYPNDKDKLLLKNLFMKGILFALTHEVNDFKKSIITEISA